MSLKEKRKSAMKMSRRIKREKASLSPVDVCRSKTSLLKLPTKNNYSQSNKVIVCVVVVVVVAVATRVKH